MCIYRIIIIERVKVVVLNLIFNYLILFGYLNILFLERSNLYL